MRPPRIAHVVDGEGLRQHLEEVGKVLGNISFGTTLSNGDTGQNIQCWKASGASPGVANTEFAITHNLKRIPLTIAGQDTDNGGLLYRGATAWTATTIYLKCTTAAANYKVVVI